MDVRERLQRHLNILFEKAPHVREVFDLQEELLANSLARFNDLTERGMPEEDAYQSVIGSIGNVDELIAALPHSSAGAAIDGIDGSAFPLDDEERRARSALITTVAVGLYVLAGAVFFGGIFFGSMWDSAVLLGLVIAVLICIAPTCLLVYNAYRWPKYGKKSETVVENFKEWNNNSQKSRALRKAISSVLWTGTLILYFLISFSSGAWYITWVIYLIAGCVESVVGLLFRIREM